MTGPLFQGPGHVVNMQSALRLTGEGSCLTKNRTFARIGSTSCEATERGRGGTDLAAAV